MPSTKRRKMRHELKEPPCPTERHHLLHEHTPLLMHLLGRAIKAHPSLHYIDADDRAQEVCLSALKRVRDFVPQPGRKKGGIGTWLGWAVRGAVRELLSRAHRQGDLVEHHRISALEDPARTLQSEALLDTADEAIHTAQEAAEIVQMALRLLPRKQARAVRLYHLQGHTLKQAGDVMGVSRERVRQSLWSAMCRMRKAMAEGVSDVR